MGKFKNEIILVVENFGRDKGRIVFKGTKQDYINECKQFNLDVEPEERIEFTGDIEADFYQNNCIFGERSFYDVYKLDQLKNK